MVGGGALAECLADPRVGSVLAIGRSSAEAQHPKLTQLLRTDLFQYDDVREQLTGLDACLFCLGVSAVGMDEPSYTRITLDLTLAAASALAEVSPGLRFCFVSGQGSDSTERGRQMWARVKGKAENGLLALSGIEAYAFRPGFIQPAQGLRSRTPHYNWFYALSSPFYPLLRRAAPRWVTSSAEVGRALVEVAVNGYGRRVLENADINRLAALPGQGA
jgi:hypothetical protein